MRRCERIEKKEERKYILIKPKAYIFISAKINKRKIDLLSWPLIV